MIGRPLDSGILLEATVASMEEYHRLWKKHKTVSCCSDVQLEAGEELVAVSALMSVIVLPGLVTDPTLTWEGLLVLAALSPCPAGRLRVPHASVGVPHPHP